MHTNIATKQALTEFNPRAGLRNVPDRLEAAGAAFLERVRTGYTELARTGDPATLVIDATADADTVAANIIAEVESRWPGFPYRD